jgi:hypothetical protein
MAFTYIGRLPMKPGAIYSYSTTQNKAQLRNAPRAETMTPIPEADRQLIEELLSYIRKRTQNDVNVTPKHAMIALGIEMLRQIERECGNDMAKRLSRASYIAAMIVQQTLGVAQVDIVYSDLKPDNEIKH